RGLRQEPARRARGSLRDRAAEIARSASRRARARAASRQRRGSGRGRGNDRNAFRARVLNRIRIVKEATMDELQKLIREIPDYPKPGILFYDLTTLLQDPRGFHLLVDKLCEHYNGKKVDLVAGIEARGFIFAPALAYRLGAGFVPIRKPRKLPSKTVSVTYQLEYGSDQLEIHQ